MIEDKFKNFLENLKYIHIEFKNYENIINSINEHHKKLLSKNTIIYYDYSSFLDYIFFYKNYLSKEYDFFKNQLNIIIYNTYIDLNNLSLRIFKSLNYFQDSSSISNLEFKNKNIDENILQSQFSSILTNLKQYENNLHNLIKFIFTNISDSKLLQDLKKNTEYEYSKLNSIYILYNKILNEIIDRNNDLILDLLSKIKYYLKILDDKKNQFFNFI